MLMGAIEDYVDRRETLVDKVAHLATSRVRNTTPQQAKSLLTKKIEDLNFKASNNLFVTFQLSKYSSSTFCEKRWPANFYFTAEADG